MAEYGIQTWDANGVPNNTGLVPVFILGYVFIADSQEGTWSYTVPSGFVLDYMMVPNPGGLSSSGRRVVSLSGAAITVTNTDSSAATPNSFPRTPYTLVAFIRTT